MDNEPILTDAPDAEPIVQLTDMPVSPAPQRPKFDWTKLLIPGAIILAGIIVSGSILYGRLSAGQALIGQTAQTQQPIQGPVNVEVGNAPYLGKSDAPVTVVEFADFQCPFCEMYFQNNEPSIMKDYVDTGKVKFVWKDYAFLGQESTWAAEAARCANDQGKFWPYHDYLYNHQGSENSGTFTKAKLEGFAAKLGLNTSSFNSCLESDKYATAVQQDTQYGSSIGVTGTPATFVDGNLISGAVPYVQIKSAIDAALAGK
ncbi:MAG TPA: DsbA family protein [Candidatus Paceibacterota bacterium]|nr:DsbA family protein [Candidatus Paceibacterota bacterium]